MSYGSSYGPSYAAAGARGGYYQPVATLDETARSAFVIKVYQHLLAAIAVFVGFEALLINLGAAEAIYKFVSASSFAWLAILGGFMVVSWFATQAAHDLLNPARQYLALFAIAGAEALIFAPLLHFTFNIHEGGASTVAAAGVITAMGFAGLTAVALTTRRDLSWIRPILMWGFMAALVLIVAAVLFGLNLGVWFSVGMIALAGGSILYQTQTIMRNYPTDAYVGASVQLFASVMLLLWYVLNLLLQLNR